MKAKDIERAARRMQVNRDAIDHKRILADARTALTRPAGKLPRPGIGRTIIEQTATKWAIAATILIGVIVAALYLDLSVDGSSVVLAKAARRVAQAGSVTWREKRVVTYDGSEVSFMSNDATWYYAPEYGARQDICDTTGRLLHRTYWLPRENVRIRIVPPVRQYECTELTEVERMVWGQPTVTDAVGLLASARPTSLGRQKVNGREAEGFQVIESDPSFYVLNWLVAGVSPFRDDGGTARFWIDIESSLPVLYEAEMTTNDRALTSAAGAKPVRVVVTGYEPQWNVPLEPGLFEPNIPADYVAVEWQPAGAFPVHDIPDEEYRRLGHQEWLRQNPGRHRYFYTNRNGFAMALENRFLVDIAAFRFHGGPDELRSLHEVLDSWFASTPTATKAYYTILDSQRVERFSDYCESSDSLTLSAQPAPTITNGHKYLVDLAGLGSLVVYTAQRFKEPTVDLGLAFFAGGWADGSLANVMEAAVDLPSVRIRPGEGVLIKLAENETPTEDAGMLEESGIMIRLQEVLR